MAHSVGTITNKNELARNWNSQVYLFAALKNVCQDSLSLMISKLIIDVALQFIPLSEAS